MNRALAAWLTHNRDTLLPRWIAVLEAILIPVPALAADEGGIVAHPQERYVLIGALYDGMTSAADGDTAQLDECLRLLRALRTTPGEDELPQQIELIFRLRQCTRELLLANHAAGNNGHDDTVQQLNAELEELTEHAVVTATSAWVHAARSIARELQETQLLVETLYHDAEVTDRTTLHVSQLNEMIQGLAATLDRDQQIAIVGTSLIEVLQLPAVSIWLHDGAANALALARCWPDELPAAMRIATDDGRDPIARAFAGGEELLIEPAAERMAWQRSGHYALVVPLMAQRRAIGMLALQHTGTEVFGERSEIEFIRSAASQAAIALENARLYEEVRRFNAELERRITERTRELQLERDTLETLNTIALEISSTLDEDVLLESSLSALAQLVGVNHGSIMLVDRETDHLVDRAVLGGKQEVGYTRFPIGQGIVGWVAQHRKAELIDNIENDSRWRPPPDDDGTHKRSGSMIAIPLIAHHEVQGVLLLSHEQPGYFHEEHLRLLNATANQIAIGIYNAEIYKEIEQQLMHRSEMQRRQEEAASQSTAILQSLSDGVIVCDAYGSVLTANPAVERILERPIEELVIWNLPELMKRLLGRRIDEVPVETLLATQDDPSDARTYSTTFQIGTNVISVKLDPVFSSKDQLMGAVAVFRDITREVESDRLKTEFIGTVSHELRTPMTSIKGFTQLLAMGSLGPVNDTQKEFLEIIQSNAERMIAIINDLLDITKIETGSVELDLRPLHVAEAISGVMLEQKPRIEDRNQEIGISIPPGLPLVRADAQRFNQILSNLVSNAVKYTPRNGKIMLTARETTTDEIPDRVRDGLKSDGRFVQIDIADTGVGIALDEQDRIFERFYRTENPLKVEAGGTGLGLSLVRPLVNLFGGRIWVRSKLNEGSTFSLILPAM
jgi:signal transduction histidine kinase